jgi:hypothetical protein
MLYIPSELAYGDRNQGAVIKSGSVLVFELEILKVGITRRPPSPNTNEVFKVLARPPAGHCC